MSRAAGSPIRALTLARDLALTVPLVVVMLPLWWAPWSAARGLGRLYAWIAAACWPSARRTAAINMRRALGPACTRADARARTWRMFGHLGASVAEGLQFARRYRDHGADWAALVEIEDPALEASVIAHPGPLVFVTAHLGSWEVLLQVLAHRAGRRGGAIVRRVDNPFVNALVRRARLTSDAQWIEKRGAMMESLGRLRRDGQVAVLLDENGGRRGVFVDFFGRPASTSRAAALLAMASGARVVAGVAIRQAGPRPFRIRLADLTPGADGWTARPDAVQDLTSRIAAQIERWIRESPDQWRWIHWRWRTRPDGSEETYRRRDLAETFDSRPPASMPARRTSP